MNKATIDKVKACVKEFRALLKRSGQNPRSRVTVELATLPSKYRSSPIARSRFKIVTAKTTVSELSDLRHTVKPAKNMWVVLSTKKKGGKEAWSSCPLFEPGAKPGVLTVEHTLKGGGVPARVTMARERQGGLFGPVQKALKGLEDAPKRGGMAWIKGHGWLTQRQQRDMLEAAKRKRAEERSKIRAEEVREAGQLGLFGLPKQAALFVPKSVKPKGKIKLEPWPPKAVKEALKGAKTKGNQTFLPSTGRWYPRPQIEAYVRELGGDPDGKGWFLVKISKMSHPPRAGKENSRWMRALNVIFLPGHSSYERKGFSYNRLTFDDITWRDPNDPSQWTKYDIIAKLTQEQAGEIGLLARSAEGATIPGSGFAKWHQFEVIPIDPDSKAGKSAIRAYEKARS